MPREIGIIGAGGYTGGELLRLLCRHPACRVAWATSRQFVGAGVGEVFPALRDFSDVVFSAPDLAELPAGVEAVFVALPHVEAMSVVPALLERGLKVVDLSADFRLRTPAFTRAPTVTPMSRRRCWTKRSMDLPSTPVIACERHAWLPTRGAIRPRRCLRCCRWPAVDSSGGLGPLSTQNPASRGPGAVSNKEPLLRGE